MRSVSRRSVYRLILRELVVADRSFGLEASCFFALPFVSGRSGFCNAFFFLLGLCWFRFTWRLPGFCLHLCGLQFECSSLYCTDCLTASSWCVPSRTLLGHDVTVCFVPLFRHLAFSSQTLRFWHDVLWVPLWPLASGFLASSQRPDAWVFLM